MVDVEEVIDEKVNLDLGLKAARIFNLWSKKSSWNTYIC